MSKVAKIFSIRPRVRLSTEKGVFIDPQEYFEPGADVRTLAKRRFSNGSIDLDFDLGRGLHADSALFRLEAYDSGLLGGGPPVKPFKAAGQGCLLSVIVRLRKMPDMENRWRVVEIGGGLSPKGQDAAKVWFPMLLRGGPKTGKFASSVEWRATFGKVPMLSLGYTPTDFGSLVSIIESSDSPTVRRDVLVRLFAAEDLGTYAVDELRATTKTAIQLDFALEIQRERERRKRERAKQQRPPNPKPTPTPTATATTYCEFGDPIQPYALQLSPDLEVSRVGVPTAIQVWNKVGWARGLGAGGRLVSTFPRLRARIHVFRDDGGQRTLVASTRHELGARPKAIVRGQGSNETPKFSITHTFEQPGAYDIHVEVNEIVFINELINPRLEISKRAKPATTKVRHQVETLERAMERALEKAEARVEDPFQVLARMSRLHSVLGGIVAHDMEAFGEVHEGEPDANGHTFTKRFGELLRQIKDLERLLGPYRALQLAKTLEYYPCAVSYLPDGVDESEALHPRVFVVRTKGEKKHNYHVVDWTNLDKTGFHGFYGGGSDADGADGRIEAVDAAIDEWIKELGYGAAGTIGIVVDPLHARIPIRRDDLRTDGDSTLQVVKKFFENIAFGAVVLGIGLMFIPGAQGFATICLTVALVAGATADVLSITADVRAGHPPKTMDVISLGANVFAFTKVAQAGGKALMKYKWAERNTVLTRFAQSEGTATAAFFGEAGADVITGLIAMPDLVKALGALRTNRKLTPFQRLRLSLELLSVASGASAAKDVNRRFSAVAIPRTGKNALVLDEAALERLQNKGLPPLTATEPTPRAKATTNTGRGKHTIDRSKDVDTPQAPKPKETGDPHRIPGTKRPNGKPTPPLFGGLGGKELRHSREATQGFFDMTKKQRRTQMDADVQELRQRFGIEDPNFFKHRHDPPPGGVGDSGELAAYRYLYLQNQGKRETIVVGEEQCAEGLGFFGYERLPMATPGSGTDFMKATDLVNLKPPGAASGQRVPVEVKNVGEFNISHGDNSAGSKFNAIMNEMRRRYTFNDGTELVGTDRARGSQAEIRDASGQVHTVNRSTIQKIEPTEELALSVAERQRISRFEVVINRDTKLVEGHAVDAQGQLWIETQDAAGRQSWSPKLFDGKPVFVFRANLGPRS